MNDKQFSNVTADWLRSSGLNERKALGQYMTPAYLRDYLLNKISLFPGARVLDPAVGTGEFLRSAIEIEPGIQAFGWDIDPKILQFARANVPEASLSELSALELPAKEEFDFVIGNPPYFEMKLTGDQSSRFSEVVAGRANIFALFFKVGIEALKPGGMLAYVVPPSMNNGAYFKALRRFLTNQNHILSVKVFSKSDLFVDAQTSVQVITVKKGKGKSSNVLELPIRGDLEPLIFENVAEIEMHYKNSSSLFDLGYEAVTGNIVWNQYRDSLTNDRSKAQTTLYYARNISGGKIVLVEDEKKPQYLNFVPSTKFLGPAILVNRIIGGVGKGVINAAFVPEGEVFCAENHLNVIRVRKNTIPNITFSELLELISSKETLRTARLVTGNTQLSATEWNYLLPFK
jgi:adenine-specific DNA-methyltransferase